MWPHAVQNSAFLSDLLERTRRLLPLAVIGLTAACSTPAPEARSETVTAPPMPKAAPRVAFAVGAVTPPQLALSGDQVAAQTLDVAYSIPNPETVTDAVLKFYVGEVGDIAVVPVTPDANGRATISLQPRFHGLGAFVRFRATCPSGVTDWHALGAIPSDYDTRRANVFRIATVSPQSIRWTPGMDPSVSTASGSRVFIAGPQITKECRLEAQVNGSSVELMNVHFYNNRFEGLLMHRDIGYSSVSPRYAELKLLVTRTSGQKLQAVARVPFAEPY